MSLKEIILKYSNIVVEDLSLQQLGNVIITASNQNFNNDEVINKLKILTNNNSWFNVTKKDKYAYISINPFGWNKEQGDIIDCAAMGHPEQEQQKIRYIINYWINSYAKKLRNNFIHVYYTNRITGEDVKLF